MGSEIGFTLVVTTGLPTDMYSKTFSGEPRPCFRTCSVDSIFSGIIGGHQHVAGVHVLRDLLVLDRASKDEGSADAGRDCLLLCLFVVGAHHEELDVGTYM